MNIRSLCLILLTGFFIWGHRGAVMAQNSEAGIWIDPERSDPTDRRSLIMNGNNVESMVGNWGNVGQGPVPISGVWPRGSGHDHIYEFTGFVGARVPDSTGKPVVVISDGYYDGGGTSGEFDPVTNIEYKWHPLPGYFNKIEGQDEFANSRNPVSWPDTWPGKDATWDGKWNGFFGQNQFNADQEAMYYIDDSWNSEFPFYPYEGQPERRGLGLQLHTRLFQWAHPLAKDILFFYFEVSNAGDFEYSYRDNPVIFGGFGDIGPGGRGTIDDDAWFDTDVDMVYGWDHDNRGNWTVNRDIPPGYLGWKFLESPGIETDGIDNDEDGLTDERRDNDAGEWIFGPVGKYGEPKWHWSGDEDGDWLAEIDDVGADGIYIYDEGYPGPDADGTEGNGRPDQGEPNFGRLDNDESDQVGLTSFSAPLYGEVKISDEEVMWPRLQPGTFIQPTQTVNQFWIFGSGPISLPVHKTERFSTCYAFAFNEQALFQAAEVAQRIFDSDYRFAKPPRQPVLRAIPGDEKVTLIWDDLAELSRDPIYGRDFEGYRIYRATDPQFLDVEEVTDSRGNPVFKVPIAQFDLNDGLTGPHPLQFGEEIGQPTGIHFHMGDDTGLKHYYVDEGLINGRTYYYAVTAYDKGYVQEFVDMGLYDTPNLLDITPSESPASIVVVDGIITRFDPNTVEVTPNPKASDMNEAYLHDGDTLIHAEGSATGQISVSIVDPEKVPDGEFEITFETVPSDIPGEPHTKYYTIYNSIDDTYLVASAEIPEIDHIEGPTGRWVKEMFDHGLILEFENEYPDVINTNANSGWTRDSKCNYSIEIEPHPQKNTRFPISIVVEFGERGVTIDSAYWSASNLFLRPTEPVDFMVYELGTQEPLDFTFQEIEKNYSVDPEETILYLFKEDSTRRGFNISWKINFGEPKDSYGNSLPREEWIEPQPGDKLIVRNQINFSEKDLLTFRTSKREVLENPSKVSALDRIKVVPNPYIVSSILEKQPYLAGRGERFIRFTNLPARCTIRIFTVNGDLVRTLYQGTDGSPELENGTVMWDLKSKDNLEVAFGLYVYHVDAPGIGTKIGKFAIIN